MMDGLLLFFFINLGMVAYYAYKIWNSEEYKVKNIPNLYQKPFFYRVWQDLFYNSLLYRWEKPENGWKSPKLKETKLLQKKYRFFSCLAIITGVGMIILDRS